MELYFRKFPQNKQPPARNDGYDLVLLKSVEDILLGRLINVLPCLPPARLPITAVYASRRNLPMRVRTVLDFLADAVEDELMTGAAC